MPSLHRPVELFDSPLISRISHSSPISSNIPISSRHSSYFSNSVPRNKQNRSLLKRKSEYFTQKDGYATTVPLSSPALSQKSPSYEEDEDSHEQYELDNIKSSFFKSPFPLNKKHCPSKQLTPLTRSSKIQTTLSPCLQTPLSQFSSTSDDSTPCKLQRQHSLSRFSSPTLLHNLCSPPPAPRCLFPSQSITGHQDLEKNDEKQSTSYTFPSDSPSLSKFSSFSSPLFPEPLALSSPTKTLNTKKISISMLNQSFSQSSTPLFDKLRSYSSFSCPSSSFVTGNNNTKKNDANNSLETVTLPLPTSTREPKLPSTFSSSDGIPRITSATLLKAMQGAIHGIEKVHIIDCRFPFEYRGGHIQEATNVNSFEELDSLFLSKFKPALNTAIVFHCEFSSHRAPLMAQHLRRQDRSLNSKHYPTLFYPEIYILDGGFKEFFSNHQDFCVPLGYVRMDDKLYTEECKLEHSNRKHSLMRSKSLAIKWE
ncbi:cell division cycle- protein [Coelomomyces lativittatus]|nr:cell division cycle- protein [Coelomomyces lativittatus]KAJ1506598.1 cell division cycle- protein [Coelomomyces lativittatus]KAJ1509314.1 cell division cycle- protein [Coelomomyces lativittatus]